MILPTTKDSDMPNQSMKTTRAAASLNDIVTTPRAGPDISMIGNRKAQNILVLPILQAHMMTLSIHRPYGISHLERVDTLCETGPFPL